MKIKISLLFLLSVYCFFSSLQAQDEGTKDSIKLSQFSYVELDSFIEKCADKGNYKEAIPYAEEGMERAKTKFSERDSIYIWYTGVLALMYHKSGSYDKAEYLYSEVKALTDSVLGKNHPLYTSWLNNLGSLYRMMGNYQKAESFSIEALEIIEKFLGKLNPKYATSLKNLSNIYYAMGRHEEAEQLDIEVLEIRKKTLGEEHPDYAQSLDDLAFLYKRKGEYKNAKKFLLEGLEIREKVFGKEHPDYAISLDNLAGLYKNIGKYRLAEQFYSQVLKIRENVLGKEHPDYAQAINNLSGMYWRMGRYEEAEVLLLEAKNLKESLLGKEHPDYAITLNNLSVLYWTLGKFGESELLCLEALKIIKKTLGKSHPTYGNYLSNLALLYQDMGRTEIADKLYIEAKEILENGGRNTNPDYTTLLNNIANSYRIEKKYEKAESLYLKINTMRMEMLGKEHPDYAQSIGNLAILYWKMGKYEEAELLFLKAKKIWHQNFGIFYPAYVNSLDNLAVFYSEIGENEKSEEFYLQIKEICEKVFGKKHPDYAHYLGNLMAFYCDRKSYKEAQEVGIEASNTALSLINENFKNLSEQQQRQFLETFRRGFDNLYKLTSMYPTTTLLEKTQNMSLAIKGLSLTNSNRIQRLIKSSKDSTLRKIYSDWQYTRHQIYKGYTLSPKVQKEKRVNLDSLRQQAENQEQKLARSSKAVVLQLEKEKCQVTFNDLKNNLPSNQVCVDILHFPFQNNKSGETDSILYYALLTHSTSIVPKLIRLGLEKEFQNILRSQVVAGKLNYTNHPKLYELLWKPLLPYLKGAKTIHISPSGILHKVSFEALPVDLEKEKYLVDKYDFHYYGTLRDFVLNKEKNIENREKSIVLFGGAKFKMDSTDLAELADTINLKKSWLIFEETRGIPVEGNDTTRSNGFNKLKGTLEEVQEIGKLFEEESWETNLFTEEKALENQVKKSSGKQAPSILHIATHGYFFPIPEKEIHWGRNKMLKDRLRYHPNPLFRSGLAFTGANYTWFGGIPIKGLEDGILTAYEVASLDLYNTELVVLSACETGKGDIDNNEGIFGLKRAFKTAGVDKLIISLWKVNDKATRLLMEQFYKNYLDGEPIAKALKNAQFYLRNYLNKDGEKIYSSPYFWGSFVLIN